MTGNAVIITADGTPIPSSMSCTININQEAVEYTPLPGSVTAEEEGWKHYRRGNYSWSLQNDSFLTDGNVGTAKLIGTKPQAGISIGWTEYPARSRLWQISSRTYRSCFS